MLVVRMVGRRRPQTVVQQAVQGADDEAGIELGAQVIQNQQVGPGDGLQQGVLFAGGVGAEVQRFHPAEKVGAGNVDDVEALVEGGARHRQGGVGLAQAGVAGEHQVFAVEVERGGVVLQVGQQLGHVLADGAPGLGVAGVGVVVQLHGVEAGHRQAGHGLDLLPAEPLHLPADALAGLALRNAGVLAERAGEFGFQRQGRPPAGGQQGVPLLAGLGQGGGGCRPVCAAGPGQGAVHPAGADGVLSGPQARHGGFGFGPGILGGGPGHLPPGRHRPHGRLIQLVSCAHGLSPFVS